MHLSKLSEELKNGIEFLERPSSLQVMDQTVKIMI